MDLPGLAQLRHELLEEVEKAGFAVHKDHDFTPHMTLKYLEKNEEFPGKVDRQPTSFGKVYIVAGDKRIGSHPLGTKK
jgi:2'-5' RNA ligase